VTLNLAFTEQDLKTRERGDGWSVQRLHPVGNVHRTPCTDILQLARRLPGPGARVAKTVTLTA
jgi:hypothetical protein